MKTAKVTEIVKVNEWKWPNGIIYYINMKLDNNETINLGKKKSDAFKVWDVVTYEVVEEGKKRKEIKEQPKKETRSDSNAGAIVGMALKIAFDKVYKSEDDFQSAAVLAQRICDLAVDMTKGLEEREDSSN